jgi:hypothetical protein
MNEIPRSLVIFRPKQSFVDWLNGLPDAGRQVGLATACEDPSAYLVPEHGSRDEGLAFIHAHAAKFLTHLLLEWCSNEDWWPSTLDFDALREWFDVELVSMVFDTGEMISAPSWN